MAQEKKTPPLINATVDVSIELAWLIADTGAVQEVMGGYKIKIYHTRSFPWAAVFKALLFRDFKVYVSRHKADIFIEAQP